MVEKTKKKIGGWIPAALLDETRQYSEESGLKIAAIIEKALKEYFSRYPLTRETGTT